jgi:hypothetical protein
MSMVPRAVKVGDMVLYSGLNSNGMNTHPAVVTQVHANDGMVNVMIFPDGAVVPQVQIRFKVPPKPVMFRDGDAIVDPGFYEERTA